MELSSLPSLPPPACPSGGEGGCSGLGRYDSNIRGRRRGGCNDDDDDTLPSPQRTTNTAAGRRFRILTTVAAACALVFLPPSYATSSFESSAMMARAAAPSFSLLPSRQHSDNDYESSESSDLPYEVVEDESEEKEDREEERLQWRNFGIGGDDDGGGSLNGSSSTANPNRRDLSVVGVREGWRIEYVSFVATWTDNLKKVSRWVVWWCCGFYFLFFVF